MPACKESPNKIEKGVTKELAESRVQNIKEIKYNLHFTIPAQSDKAIKAQSTVEFFLHENDSPVVLDFSPSKDNILDIEVNGEKAAYKPEKEHIIIPGDEFKADEKNIISINFIAGDQSLNRNSDYLYTLFVPDRASTAFPCFDQPDMKARFKLKLTIPQNWEAVTNGELLSKRNTGEKKTLDFAPTNPISTYLFAFTAGAYSTIEKSEGNRTITLYHKETDKKKLERNLDTIFNLQFHALDWLEDYTTLSYPFQKFDLVLIPSFQYSGMEHPGAVYYRDSKLLLDEDASIRKQLGRANLIAHETAHMWYGDLVTMKWFDEVWLKEVFANFMADKINQKQYPEINHELNFLLNHYPSSYSVDRTKGANPIQQKLKNLKNAGTLYGAIIYHKAPIVMNKLEQIIGPETLQQGLITYLSDNQYSTATWLDLIELLDKQTAFNLKDWSSTWVQEPGMPTYKMDIPPGQLVIHQEDPLKKNRIWTQTLHPEIKIGNVKHVKEVINSDPVDTINIGSKTSQISYALLNSKGDGYGYFQLDSSSINYLANSLSEEESELKRAVIWMNLWENMLNTNVNPGLFYTTLLEEIPNETNPQCLELLCRYLKSTYWKILPSDHRSTLAKKTEDMLWNELMTIKDEKSKKLLFKTYVNIAATQKSTEKIFEVWKQQKPPEGLSLTVKDYTKLANELIIREQKNTSEIKNKQVNRITDKERKERFDFILPALSSKEKKRDEFFQQLKNKKNRQKEPWVIDALHYLHHPLRAESSKKYIRESIALLPEIQKTGDIFFPKNWIEATLWGHNSSEAGEIVREFLKENQKFPENLRKKVLQSADLLFRTNTIHEKYYPSDVAK